MSEKTLHASSSFFETEEVTLNEAGFGSESPSSSASAFEGEVISSFSRPTGPKFGKDALSKIEKAKFSGWGKKVLEFAQEKKYALMSVLGVVLFAVAGFYAATALHGDALPLGLADLSEGVMTENAAVGQPNLDNAPASTGTENTATTNASELTFAAQNGQGVTHLARQAVAQYAEGSGATLSAEQRIYAEDFLKDTVGAASLEVGQEVSFTQDNVAAAVSAAEGLTEAQLANLTQYTQNVSF